MVKDPRSSMHGAGLLAVFCVLAACLISVAQARDSLTVDRTLRLRADGSFKIVQFADIHFGEGEVSGCILCSLPASEHSPRIPSSLQLLLLREDEAF